MKVPVINLDIKLMHEVQNALIEIRKEAPSFEFIEKQ